VFQKNVTVDPASVDPGVGVVICADCDPLAPDWLTVKGSPAMVIVPERGLVLLFDDTV
jgi:hypothetical protein